jgi:ankyrin repeat protein
LLKHGADVNATANDGATALMLAASSGEIESVRALLRSGADLSGRYAQNGKTALMLAKENNHAEILELLSREQSKPIGKA